MKLLGLLGLVLLVACNKDSNGPSVVGTDYCVDSVLYHSEQPQYRYTEDWGATLDNTFVLNLVNATDSTGTYSTKGRVLARVDFVQNGTSGSYNGLLFNGNSTGNWATDKGRLLVFEGTNPQAFLVDPSVYHSAPVDNKFESDWEYPRDVDSNYAFLKIWWNSCK